MESIELFHKIIKVLNVYSERMRESERYGDVILHTSELHLLETIGDNPNTRASALAGTMGLSKGRVSQLAKSLSKKKLIRTLPGKDKKEILYQLTKSGTAIHEEHKRRDVEIITPIMNCLDDVDEKSREALSRVLDVALRSMMSSSAADENQRK